MYTIKNIRLILFDNKRFYHHSFYYSKTCWPPFRAAKRKQIPWAAPSRKKKFILFKPLFYQVCSTSPNNFHLHKYLHVFWDLDYTTFLHKIIMFYSSESEARFFYKTDWLTWIRLWSLSQIETMFVNHWYSSICCRRKWYVTL